MSQLSAVSFFHAFLHGPLRLIYLLWSILGQIIPERKRKSLYNPAKAHVQTCQYEWMRITPLSPSFRNVFTCQVHKCLWQRHLWTSIKIQGSTKKEGIVMFFLFFFTLPSSTLCLDSSPPPFFTATSTVLLCSSTIDTLNSKLANAKQEETVTSVVG